jgi:hypothetical protein
LRVALCVLLMATLIVCLLGGKAVRSARLA